MLVIVTKHKTHGGDEVAEAMSSRTNWMYVDMQMLMSQQKGHYIKVETRAANRRKTKTQ